MGKKRILSTVFIHIYLLWVKLEIILYVRWPCYISELFVYVLCFSLKIYLALTIAAPAVSLLLFAR